MKLALLLALCVFGCSKKDDAGAAKTNAAAPAAGDKLAWQPDMKHESPACHKALACCEAMVVAGNPAAKAEDYNLKCSGVALASADPDCDAFRKGYAAEASEGGKTAPSVCQ